jgi:hypothetical protein
MFVYDAKKERLVKATRFQEFSFWYRWQIVSLLMFVRSGLDFVISHVSGDNVFQKQREKGLSHIENMRRLKESRCFTA